MSVDRETNLALFIDFDNVALGARDARQRFDVKLLLQRILEKGKIIVKRAYADWHFYKEYMSPLHEAAIELIEIPMPKISGKNSADIKLVVDAMDLCYSKEHIDTFVIVSGDSDFSPLVSKLRENDKRVIGVGVKNSSSKLLIGNCDEFIFYDDIYRQATDPGAKSAGHVPLEKRDLFDFLVSTAQSLLQESRGVLYSSLIKDTMTRKKPDFNERAYGYSTFGDLLEEARKLGLLVVERDARAGGTWVVQGLGSGVGATATAPAAPAAGGQGERHPGKNGGGRSGRRRRRSGDRVGAKPGAEEHGTQAHEPAAAAGGLADGAPAAPPSVPAQSPATSPAPQPAAERGAETSPTATGAAVKGRRGGRSRAAAPAKGKAAKAPAPKAPEAGAPGAPGAERGRPARKTAAKKAPARKGPAGKKTAKKAEPRPGAKSGPKSGAGGAQGPA